METIKQPATIISSLALVGTIASTTWFYNDNKNLRCQLESLTNDIKEMRAELMKTIKRQDALIKKQTEIINHINVNHTLTQQANEQLIYNKNDLNEVYEKVDVMSENIQAIGNAIKTSAIGNGINLELNIEDTKTKQKSSRRNTGILEPIGSKRQLVNVPNLSQGMNHAQGQQYQNYNQSQPQFNSYSHLQQQHSYPQQQNYQQPSLLDLNYQGNTQTQSPLPLLANNQGYNNNQRPNPSLMKMGGDDEDIDNFLNT